MQVLLIILENLIENYKEILSKQLNFFKTKTIKICIRNSIFNTRKRTVTF